MRISLLLAATAILSASVAARADLVYDYDLNATLEGGGTVTGVLYVHAIFGGVGYADFTAEDGGNTYSGLVLGPIRVLLALTSISSPRPISSSRRNTGELSSTSTCR